MEKKKRGGKIKARVEREGETPGNMIRLKVFGGIFSSMETLSIGLVDGLILNFLGQYENGFPRGIL